MPFNQADQAVISVWDSCLEVQLMFEYIFIFLTLLSLPGT
jgi:hypothetical protein